jgi:hypothetical protein
MAIVIKEISVKATIEARPNNSLLNEKDTQQLKAEIMEEIKAVLKKTTLRKAKR